MMRWQFLIDASPTALAPPFSPKMLSYSMVSMLAAGLSVLVSWPQNDLITHILLSNKPSVFFNTSIVVLLANAYVNLCTGRGEVVESTVPDKLALKDQKKAAKLLYAAYVNGFQGDPVFMKTLVGILLAENQNEKAKAVLEKLLTTYDTFDGRAEAQKLLESM